MSNDTELFELCKEVYEKFPEWNDTLQCVWNGKISMPEKSVVDYGIESKYTGYHPLYTSDYLLEKLPTKTRVEKHHIMGHPDKRKHLPDYDVYNAYRHTATAQHWVQSDTPLKALLKLTLALHEAGIELKEPSDV